MAMHACLFRTLKLGRVVMLSFACSSHRLIIYRALLLKLDLVSGLV